MTDRVYDSETMKLRASQAEVELENFLVEYHDWLMPSERKALDKALGVVRSYG